MMFSQIGKLACSLALLSACAAPGTSTAQHTKPVALNNTHPAYPLILAASGIEGTVHADCGITSSGSTDDCHVLSSTDPLFDASTLAYVRSARYQPATLNGIPVRVEHHVFNINYRLYRLDPGPMTAQYQCAVDQVGSVQSCVVTSRSPSPFMTGFMPGMTRIVRSLRLVPSLVDGKAIADPARQITVAVSATSYPAGMAARLPPSDLQIDIYMSCTTEAGSAFTGRKPHCTRIAPADLSSINRSEGEAIIKISVGFSGLIPSTHGVVTSPPAQPAINATPPAPAPGGPAVTFGFGLG